MCFWQTRLLCRQLDLLGPVFVVRSFDAISLAYCFTRLQGLDATFLMRLCNGGSYNPPRLEMQGAISADGFQLLGNQPSTLQEKTSKEQIRQSTSMLEALLSYGRPLKATLGIDHNPKIPKGRTVSLRSPCFHTHSYPSTSGRGVLWRTMYMWWNVVHG